MTMSNNNTSTFDVIATTTTKRKNKKRQRSFIPTDDDHDDDNNNNNRKQQLLILLNDYYERLIYQCHKDIQKQIKVIKNFIIQKQIRTLKKVKETSSSNSNNNNTNNNNNKQQQQQQEEMKLRWMKEWNDCTTIIKECDRRLGIVQLNPKLLVSLSLLTNRMSEDEEEENDDDDNNNDNSSINNDNEQVSVRNMIDGVAINCKSDPQDDVVINISATTRVENKNDNSNDVNQDKHDNEQNRSNKNDTGTSHNATTSINNNNSNINMMDRIMKHKTMMDTLERWHNEVTQYRIWSLQQQEKYDGTNRFHFNNDDSKDHNVNNNKKKRINTSNKIKSGTSIKAVTSESLLSSSFVQMGGGDATTATYHEGENHDDNNMDNPYSHYGPAASNLYDTNKKKNRQGQRGRRAKVAAIEAKRNGRTISSKEESLNWRGNNKNSNNKKNQLQQNNNDTNNSTYSSRKVDYKTSNNNNNNFSERHNDNQPKSTTTTTTIQTESLHPSWQAKKEKKDTIVAFQGKKITFDDTD